MKIDATGRSGLQVARFLELSHWGASTRTARLPWAQTNHARRSSAPRRGGMVMPVGTSVFASVSCRGLLALRRARSVAVGVVAMLLLATSVTSTAYAQSTTTVTAEWDRNTDAVTTGYVVYYGTASGSVTVRAPLSAEIRWQTAILFTATHPL